MLIESFLSEGRHAPLYHLMDIEKAEPVLAANAIEARWEHDIPGLGKRTGISLTRNARLTWGKTVRLTLNQAALSQRYKIIPLDGEMAFRNTFGYSPLRDRVYHQTNHGMDPTWQEEFLVGNIEPLNRYVTAIEVRTHSMKRERGGDLMRIKEVVQAYGNKYGISVLITPDTEAQIAKYIEYISDPDY